MQFIDLSTVPQTLIQYVNAVLKREGGYVDNPNDSGGATNGGITLRTARRYGYEGSMQDLSLEWKQQIYIQKYWFLPHFDLIQQIHAPLAEELFDAGVLSGQRTPVKWLQRILNVANRGGQDYADIGVDGLIGHDTCEAIEKYRDKRGDVVLNILTNGCDSMQFAFFVELCEKHSKDEDFFNGWTRRTHSRAAHLVEHGMDHAAR